MRTLLLGWSLTWPDWVARASFSKYISDWLVAKELWLCKQTSSSGCTLGLGSFTAIIPCQPVNKHYISTFLEGINLENLANKQYCLFATSKLECYLCRNDNNNFFHTFLTLTCPLAYYILVCCCIAICQYIATHQVGQCNYWYGKTQCSSMQLWNQNCNFTHCKPQATPQCKRM